jgi:hypothetical protein
MIGLVIFFFVMAVGLSALAVLTLTASERTEDTVFGVVLLFMGGFYILLGVFALTRPKPLDWDKAHAKVSTICSPYQVRNLHKASHHSLVFNCANDKTLRVVVVERKK